MNHALYLLLALSSIATQPAPVPVPKVEPIRFPLGPTPTPIPTPMPSPDAVFTLAPDHWFVIDASVECTVDVYPEGSVKVGESTGPVNLRGKFVDGSGDVETRKYNGPFVYDLQPAKGAAGTVQIVVREVGKKTKEGIRKTLNLGAQPPPTPIPSPVPDVKPTPKAVGKLSVVAVLDRKVADPAQAQAIASDALRSFLTAGGHELDLFDLGTPTGKQQAAPYDAYAAKAGVTAPYLLVMDLGSTPPGKVLAVVSLPSKETDEINFLKSLVK